MCIRDRSTPVEILGLNDVPFSGEVLMAHGNEKEARATADAFIAYGREKMLEETKNKLSLDDLFDQIQAVNVKELNLVVKADVQGSVEAVKQSLMKLSNEDVYKRQPICCVIPPASPAVTCVERIASRREVLPWST